MCFGFVWIAFLAGEQAIGGLTKERAERYPWRAEEGRPAHGSAQGLGQFPVRHRRWSHKIKGAAHPGVLESCEDHFDAVMEVYPGNKLAAIAERTAEA